MRYLIHFIAISCLLLLVLFFSIGQAQNLYTIQYDDGNTVYYSGRPQPLDTCGVWFEPPTACKIVEAMFQFNGGMGGDAEVFVWSLAPDFDPDDYYDNDEPGWPGFAPSPLGEVLAGPITYSFDNSGDWQNITFEDWGYPPEILDVGSDPFFIGYVLLGGMAQPYYPSILGDAGDERPYHSLAWLTNPGGMYANESGWWAYGIDWMLRATVDLYGDPPPEISDLEDPPDTYTAGPYTITATITDKDSTGQPGSGQVAEALLIYTIDGGPENVDVMVNTVGDTYQGEIPAVPVGSQINFRVEAEDNAGHVSVAPGAGGYLFRYQQPSGAAILLVNDSRGVEGEQFYTNALGTGGYNYDYWYIDPGNIFDMGYPGTDVFTTDIYNSLVWFTGPANTGSLPDNDADLSTEPVALFLDAGGNLFLSSSDYLGGAFNPDDWDDFVTIPGTFMYEYLFVESGWSDSHLNPVTGESQDTLYYGVAGDPISGDLTGGLYTHPDPNYNDFVYPRPGVETCFYTEIDDEPAGIRYDVNYYLCFLPWTLEACDDPAIGQTVLLNFLGQLAMSVNVVEGSRYGIYGDTPHPVSAFASDPSGLNSVNIHLAWDGGVSHAYPMTYAGGDQYTYTFTPPPGWSTLEYYVEAENNIGQTAESPLYECWTTGLEYLTGANLLYCSDQAYTYENFDTLVTNVLDPMTYLLYQTWDVDEHGTPDYWTVLSHYLHCIWVGFGDWIDSFPMQTIDNPFARYLENGGDLLFSSEEMMGNWTSWTNYTFSPGEIAYDWLGVEYVEHDINYQQIYLTDPVDPVCQGMASPINLLNIDPNIPHFEDIITPKDPEAPTLFIYNNQDAGIRDDEDAYNMIHLCFSLFRMEQDQLDIFIPNVIDYFVLGAGDPLTITLTPYNPPIQIPASGGSFDFNVEIENGLFIPQIFDAWIMTTLPNGMQYGPVLGPLNLTLSAGQVLTRDRTQAVPAVAPTGNYLYTGYLGIYPFEVFDQDEFPFEKLATGDGIPVDEWSNSGEPFDAWLTPPDTGIPDQFALYAAYPNPFNPVTKLTFALPEAARTDLKIYDVSGRLVTNLIDGWRDAGVHEILFDGSGLASGIYIARIQAGSFCATGKMVLVK